MLRVEILYKSEKEYSSLQQGFTIGFFHQLVILLAKNYPGEREKISQNL